MASIRYFIPEDGDTEINPNVFLAPKPRHQGAPPTLGQIKQSFPLPGRYHFRFKSALIPGGDREKGSMYVWMDCMDENKPVPVWQGTVVAKVTRVGIAEDDDFDEDDFKSMRDVHPATNTPPTPAPAQQHHHHHSVPIAQSMPPKQPETPIDIFGGAPPSAPRVHVHQSAPPHSGGGGDLLGDFGSPLQQHHHHHPSSSNGHHQNHHANDFLGMANPPPTNHNYPQPPMQQQQQPLHQQQHQQPLQHQNSGGKGFDKFSQQNGPFGDLGLGQW